MNVRSCKIKQKFKNQSVVHTVCVYNMSSANTNIFGTVEATRDCYDRHT